MLYSWSYMKPYFLCPIKTRTLASYKGFKESDKRPKCPD